MCVNGKGAPTIAKVLEEKGIPNPTQYTQFALDFSNFNSSSFKYIYNYNDASWYFNNMYGVGGYFTSFGKIITFWF